MSKNRISLFMLTLLMTSSLSAQQYYRWVDADGVTHYSQQQPIGNSQAERETLDKTPLTVAIPSAQRTPQQATTEVAKPADSTETLLKSFGKDPERCAQILQSLETMSKFENIVMTDPANGNGVYLSETERAAEKTRLENMRAYYC